MKQADLTSNGLEVAAKVCEWKTGDTQQPGVEAFVNLNGLTTLRGAIEECVALVGVELDMRVGLGVGGLAGVTIGKRCGLYHHRLGQFDVVAVPCCSILLHVASHPVSAVLRRGWCPHGTLCHRSAGIARRVFVVFHDAHDVFMVHSLRWDGLHVMAELHWRSTCRSAMPMCQLLHVRRLCVRLYTVALAY